MVHLCVDDFLAFVCLQENCRPTLKPTLKRCNVVNDGFQSFFSMQKKKKKKCTQLMFINKAPA